MACMVGVDRAEPRLLYFRPSSVPRTHSVPSDSRQRRSRRQTSYDDCTGSHRSRPPSTIMTDRFEQASATFQQANFPQAQRRQSRLPSTRRSRSVLVHNFRPNSHQTFGSLLDAPNQAYTAPHTHAVPTPYAQTMPNLPYERSWGYMPGPAYAAAHGYEKYAQGPQYSQQHMPYIHSGHNAGGTSAARPAKQASTCRDSSNEGGIRWYKVHLSKRQEREAARPPEGASARSRSASASRGGQRTLSSSTSFSKRHSHMNTAGQARQGNQAANVTSTRRTSVAIVPKQLEWPNPSPSSWRRRDSSPGAPLFA